LEGNVEPGHIGQFEVEQNEIGFDLAGEPESIRAIGSVKCLNLGLGDLRQPDGEEIAEDVVILDA
jgi:hypothetical protein